MSERKIRRVAIIGSGQMGSGIGLEFARFDYDVCLQDIKTEALRHSMQAIREALDLMVETELITADEAKVAFGQAPFIPLVEVIGGRRTNPVFLEQIAKLLRSMHKRVVLQRLELPTGTVGWGNALQHPMEEIVRKLVDEKGCEPGIVDDLIRFGFGLRLPFTATFLRWDWISFMMPPKLRV